MRVCEIVDCDEQIEDKKNNKYCYSCAQARQRHASRESHRKKRAKEKGEVYSPTTYKPTHVRERKEGKAVDNSVKPWMITRGTISIGTGGSSCG